MLLTICNLPAKTRYLDVKALIQSKCGFKDLILDNLTTESNDTKRVTVGLAEEEDAAILVRKINGLFVDGQQLYVETIKKKAPTAVMDVGGNQSEKQRPLLQQPYYQQNKFQPNYELNFTQMQQSRSMPMAAVPMAYSGMFGGAQNASVNFGYPQQMQAAHQQMMAQSMGGYDQRAPLGFGNQGKNPGVWSAQNDWNHAANASAVNQIFQQDRGGSSWTNTGDEPARIFNRDRAPRYGHDALPRDAGRGGSRRSFERDSKSRDRGRGAPRDQGRDRTQGRDRDHGRDRDQGRDRFQGRDRDQGRGRSRDAPARGRGREPLARNASFREPQVRDTPPREQQRVALYDRRGPTKRQITPTPAPIYGQHVTEPSQHMRTFSQQRGGPKPNQPWAKPQLKQNKAESNYAPPLKRSKNFAAQKSDKPPVPVQVKKHRPFDIPENMPIKAATWRHQIASHVSKEIMQNPKHTSDDIPTEQLIAGLKRGIWERLEKLFGGDLEIRMPEMLRGYKDKFGSEDDTKLFNQVKILKKNELLAANAGEKAAPVPKKAAPVTKKPAAVTKKAGPATKKAPGAPQEQPVDGTPTIPCYPHGDKRANKGQKKANAHIFEDEAVLVAKMKPAMQKAVTEEVEELHKALTSEFEGEADVEFKEFNEKVKAPCVVQDCAKMVTVNLAKRLLNIGPIMMRIYTVPKPVSRSKLAPILAEYGVTSLRKSERKKPSVYYGTCKTYDEHDRLCQMEPLVVDGMTVLIKPFHLTGKAEKRAGKINIDKDWLKVDRDDDNVEEELNDEIDEDGFNLTNEDQSNVQEDDDEEENKNEETGEQDQDVQNTAMADDEDTNGNIKFQTNEEEENIDQNDAENAEFAVEPETEAEQNDIDSVEVKGNTEVVKTEQIENTPIANKDDDNKFDANIDFTADVEPETKTQKKVPIHLEAERDHSEVKGEDLEDLKGSIIDMIDMDDLNDDDLEDW